MRREEWFENQLDLDPDRLVFLDETWASTNMARRHGRCRRGERLRVGIPHGHWKTTTFVAGLTSRGMIAPWVLDGPINREAFETYVEKVLVPELMHDAIVVMDNLSSHKGPKRPRDDRGCRGRGYSTFPPYSPDFNPIEKRLRQAESAASQSSGEDYRRPVEHHRPNRRYVYTQRMSKLLQRCRIRCNLREFCSSAFTISRLRCILI